MHSMPVETSVSELDALQTEFKRVYGPSFEDLPNKGNTLFIFVQQGFENVAVMMDYIVGMGIASRNIFMVTKPQTTSDAMRERFQAQVGHYIDFEWDAPINRRRSHYTQKSAATCQQLLNEVSHFLIHQQGHDFENVLVLDEGGRFLSLAAETLCNWRDQAAATRRIIAIEHTMSGTRDFDSSTLDFPYILMADCFLKTQIEAQYVAEGVIEAAREALESVVDEHTVFGVIGCGNVGRCVIELLVNQYPDRRVLVSDSSGSVMPQVTIDEKGWTHVRRMNTNSRVFKNASIIFGCTGNDITAGLSRAQIAGSTQHTTLISASSGDREFTSLLLDKSDYQLCSPADICDIDMKAYEFWSYFGLSQRITIKNGGFPVNFSPDRSYGIALDKVGITLAMKFAAVQQALELFSLFQLAQNHDDAQKREWLTSYMMLDPKAQQIILENFPLAENQPLSVIKTGSYGGKPMTKAKITGESTLTKLLGRYYQGRGTIPLMFREESLPMDQVFIRLRIKSHLARQEHVQGYWPLERLFEQGASQRPIRHIVIEGEPGVGKTTLSQFIGFACFNRSLYEQVSTDVEVDGAEEEKGDEPVEPMPTSPILKEVNQWASLFKGVMTLRLRELNGFTYQVDFDRTQRRYTRDQYQLAEFILSQHGLLNNNAIVGSPEERADTLLGWLYSTEGDIKPRDHYLLMLDGYDELTAGMYQDPEVGGHAVLQALLDYPYWILTSRPNQVDSALVQGDQCDRHLVLDGFSKEDVESYVKTVLPLLHNQLPEEGEGEEEASVEQKVNSLLEFLANRPSLKQLARVPICCQLLCYLWNEAQARLERMDSLTPALLYKEMILLLAARARIRQAAIKLEVIDDNEMGHQALADYYHDAFQALTSLAFAKLEGDENLQLVVSEADLLALGLSDDIKTTITRALHLLNPTQAIEHPQQGFTTDHPEAYEFTHLSFQEFLAANELARQLASNEEAVREGAIEFVRQNKYNPHYRNMLGFSSSIIMEDDCNLLWQGDEIGRELAKVSFWAGVREGAQEESSEHMSLLVDLWMQMGSRVTELPEREDGRDEYDGLEDQFVGITERLFADEEISEQERGLLSALNRVPPGEMEGYFPRVHQLCHQSIEANILNLGRCGPFIDVFCDDGKLMQADEERILRLLNNPYRNNLQAVYQCIDNLGWKLLPDSITNFLQNALQNNPIRALKNFRYLGKLLTEESGVLKQSFLALLQDTTPILCKEAFLTLGDLGDDFLLANQDFFDSLLGCLNNSNLNVRANAFSIVGKFKSNPILENEVLGRHYVNGFSDENWQVREAVCNSLCLMEVDFISAKEDIKNGLIACLQDHQWQVVEAAWKALQKMGSDFILANPPIEIVWIDSFESKYWQTQLAACETVGLFSNDATLLNEDVLAGLGRRLKGASRLVSQAACRSLVLLGNDFIRMNPYLQFGLISCLSSPEWQVREDAESAVAKLGLRNLTIGSLGSEFVMANEEVRRSLTRGLLSTNQGARYQAWQSLSELGENFVLLNDDVCQSIVQALSHDDEVVRAAACNGVGLLGPRVPVENIKIHEKLTEEAAKAEKAAAEKIDRSLTEINTVSDEEPEAEEALSHAAAISLGSVDEEEYEEGEKDEYKDDDSAEAEHQATPESVSSQPSRSWHSYVGSWFGVQSQSALQARGVTVDHSDDDSQPVIRA